MNHTLLTTLILILSIICLSCTDSSSETKTDSKNKRTIRLADPTIFYHLGTYYLYGTVTRGAGQGFLVYTSTDMKDWEGPKGIQNGYALREEDTYGDRGFWAPQVFYHNDKFYMAYTANEHIAIAESESPLGPFTQTTPKPLAAPVRQIDPFVFIDDNGTKYLYHVRLTEGNKIFVAEMTDDFSAIKPETLQECITATDPWENTANAEWPVTEGPSILKHNNLYYLIYSANHFRNPDYAVGYAVSTTPYGPWEKYEGNPVLSRKDIGKNGTGHGDFTQGQQGNLYYVFHTHHTDSLVSPRKTAIVNAQFRESQDNSANIDELVMDEESFHYLRLKE